MRRVTRPARPAARELDRRQERRWQLVLLALVLGYLLAFSIINFRGMTQFINSDIYADTLIAKYMWEDKSIFPRGWVFGNQYYVIATPVLAALFYGLTGSVNTAMALATTAMTLLILAALAWMLQAFLDRTRVITAMAVIMASMLAMNLRYKLEAHSFFVLASYYSCYLLTLLVVWGDYAQGLFRGKRLLCPSFVLGLLLSFACGMQSIRQTCVMTLPLLAFEGLRVLGMALGKLERNWQPTLRAAASAAANLAGLVFIRLLDVPAVSVYGSMSLLRPEQLPERLVILVREIAKVVGVWWYGECSPAWFVIAFGLLCFVTVLAALVKAALAAREGRAGAMEALLCLCVISLAAVAACGLVFDMIMRSPYLFVWYPLVCLSAVYLIGPEPTRWRQGALLVVCVVSAANLYFSYGRSVAISLQKEDSEWSRAADILMENHFEILYGRCWDAGIICAHTDGAVVYSPWFDGVFRSLGYICPQDLRDPEDNARAAYLLMNDEVGPAFEQAAARGVELEIVEQLESMGIYTASEQLMLPPE